MPQKLFDFRVAKLKESIRYLVDRRRALATPPEPDDAPAREFRKISAPRCGTRIPNIPSLPSNRKPHPTVRLETPYARPIPQSLTLPTAILIGMREKSLGFTLIELLITVAMVAILLSLGVPAMRELIQNNCQATQLNGMMTSLNLARASAVKHGADTVVCVSDGAAPPNCSSTSDAWENGWIVFVDGDSSGTTNALDTNGDGAWDAGEDWLLQTYPALECGATLRGNANVDDSVNYNPRGFSVTGTLRLCDNRGAEEARGIVISNTGRPRLATDSDADGIVEDGSENNLFCP